MSEERPTGTTAEPSLAVKYPALKAFPEVLERLDTLDAMVRAAEEHAEHWEARAHHLYRIVEDIYIEELNGVLCTPPYKTYKTSDDIMDTHSFPDYDAAVSRMYCASCRSIWRRIHAAVQKHDAETATSTEVAPKDGVSP